MIRAELRCLGLAVLAGLLAGFPCAGEEPAPGAAAARLLGRPEQESPILARFGGETITVAQFEAEMARRAPQGLGAPAGRRALLDEMLLFRVLVAQARERGYERDPEVVALLERTLVAKLLRDQLDPRLAAIAASEAEAEAFYEARRGEFTQPARAEVAIVEIAVPPGAGEALRAERRRRAEEALEAARGLPPGTAHFGEVAARYSDHRESRAFGGRLGWLTEGAPARWDAALLRAAFAPSGPPLQLIETEGAFYLLKVLRREERRPLPFASLKDGLRVRLAREKRERERQRFEAAALAAAPIEIDARLLAGIAPPPVREAAPPPAPPSLPGGPAGDPENLSANPTANQDSLPGNIP